MIVPVLLLCLLAGSARAADDADEALLRALLVLYSGADGPARAPGATALGELGDARAVGPLATASAERSLAVRTAAIKALARYDTPESQRALKRAARESDEPELCRLAVESLAQQGPSGGRALLELAGDDGASEEVRRLALARARERFPELLRSSPPPPDTSGRAIAVISGALFGGYTLAAVGNLGANRAGPAIGAVGGALVGGGAALLLTQSNTLSRGQAAGIATAGGWGLATGLVAGALTDRNPSSTTVTSLGLLGELAGLVPALALRERISLSGGDVFFANLAGLAGVSVAAGSLLYLPPRDDVRPGMAITMAAGLAGLGAGAYFARDLRFGSSAQLAVPIGALMGGLLTSDLTGALGPFDDQRARRNGGAWLLGAGLGAASAGALAQVAPDLSAADDLGILAGGLLARFAAGGATRLLTASETSDDGAAAAGLLAGSIASGALLPHTRLDGPRLMLGSLGAGWGLWQGLGFAAYHDKVQKPGLSDSEIGAVARMSFGLGGVAGLLLAPLANVSAGQGMAATSVGIWALWLTHWINFIGDSADSKALLMDLVLSDAGLAAGALAVSPGFRVPPAAIGIVSLYGAGGAALFSLGAALFTGNQSTGHPIAAANVAGTIIGLTAGVIGAASWHRGLYGSSESSSELRLAGVPLPQIVPLLAQKGAGLSLVWR
jgi:hypothetical protein